MHICTTNNNSDNDDAEGFGYRWDSPGVYNTFTTSNFPGLAPNNGAYPSSAMNACFKPLCGLLTQSKFIPLMWYPITFEFEICSGATDAIISPSGATGTFNTSNTSTNWQIQDVRMVADVITLDSGLQNSYAEHVLQDKPPY